MAFKISEYLDKNNLHHAYLIEGASEKIVPEIFKYAESLGIKTSANPDFCHISLDFLKIKQALDLRSMGDEKSFGSGKKIFIVSVNRFSKDAEGVLLKMFEEPIENTHFFIITPDVNVLTKTLISRFYLIKTGTDSKEGTKEVEKFLAMPLKNRIDFIKEFVAVSEKDEEDDEFIEKSSVRSKAFEFLNSLEYVLHKKLVLKTISNTETDFFEQIFKAREFLRQQGSPTKTLIESVALVVPKF